jgi:small glutamine-rich tetratricopeptide repeat-containing protein alpha
MSQRLVYAIIEFLNQSIDDGTVKADDKEGLEVASASHVFIRLYPKLILAVQCIGEAFNVDPSNQQQVEQLSVKPATLRSIFDVYIKTRDKVNSSAQASSSSTSTLSSNTNVPSPEDIAEAEKFKGIGNKHMSSKKYDDAIETYDKAIALNPANPIYYSNRAAAHSSKGDHLSAVGDAEKAISVDPKFAKAYHRLGCVGCIFSARGRCKGLNALAMLNIPSEITQPLRTLSNEDWSLILTVQASSLDSKMLVNALLLILT